ncbi:MAG: response regulator [Oscillospiraceae bacterium]|nr:response regulator [Oscillospiraceae bacterium]
MKITRKLIKANYQQVLFVFLAFLTMVLVSYFYVSTIVQRQMLALGEETMNTTQTAVSASLSETELTFSNVTQNIENMFAMDRNNDEILYYLTTTNNFFKTERSPLPDCLKVYGYVRGEFLDGSGWIPPDDYSPPERPWYIGAEQSGHAIFFSEPYIDADTGGMCISFSQQVFDQIGNALGIIAIDLNLTRITDYIAGQQIANDGYGVLVDDAMRFTSHRDFALITTDMRLAGGGYPELAEMLRTGRPIAAERFIDSDGTDSIAFFRTIFNGWHIGVIIPRASYYEQVYSLGIVLSILGSVLMLSLCYILVRTRADQLRSDEESKSKSSFLARMSHEMRTPMNAIIGMTSLAQKSNNIDKIQEYLGKTNDAANHLLGVINDVLDMSKIEAGKLELSNAAFPLQSLLSQVQTVVGFKIDEKKQHFTVSVADDVPNIIITDQQRLAQILTNLLSNANKFTPEGGDIALNVRKIEGDASQCVLQIEVADNGIGISKEQQARLFKSFEQADNSISRKYGGTGLGLAISKKIIDLMQGNAWIESELGAGARFIFTAAVGIGDVGDLPESSVLSGTGADESTPSAPIFAGKHALLAEDVEINREILIALLSDTGIVIDCAENGRQACEMFRSGADLYDLIFMDVHMPEVDGYEATRRIRAMSDVPKSKDIPIIAMTANVFKEDIDKCLAAGMNDHVGKPIELNNVLAKMKHYLLYQ